jgi:FkbM family methyltransferase
MTKIKKILRNILHRFPNSNIKSKILEFIFFILERKNIKVNFIDNDYIYTWEDGKQTYIDDVLYFKPISTITTFHNVFLQKYTPKLGDIVFDIGAGYGSEVTLFSNLVGPHGHVYLIESDPHALKKLHKLQFFLNLKNITILNIAVSSKNETVFFSFDTPGDVANRIDRLNTFINRVEVSAFTLDTIVEKYKLDKIDYIKMNIEGSEKDALVGFTKKKLIVKNWCISCHDFLQNNDQKTFEFVKINLNEDYKFVTKYPLEDINRCESFYLYASN